MKIEGMIKSIKGHELRSHERHQPNRSARSVWYSSWRELRGMMQKPLTIELIAKQMKFGEKSEDAVETTVVKAGKKKKPAKDLVPVI